MWSTASEERRAGRMRGLRQISARGLTYRVMCIPWNVPQYAASHGLGLEEAARILRYEAFEEEAGRYPLRNCYAADQKQGNSRQAVVAVAHHMEDNAETFFFRCFAKAERRDSPACIRFP